jgi:hypothetical protein
LVENCFRGGHEVRKVFSWPGGQEDAQGLVDLEDGETIVLRAVNSDFPAMPADMQAQLCRASGAGKTQIGSERLLPRPVCHASCSLR